MGHRAACVIGLGPLAKRGIYLIVDANVKDASTDDVGTVLGLDGDSPRPRLARCYYMWQGCAFTNLPRFEQGEIYE